MAAVAAGAGGTPGTWPMAAAMGGGMGSNPQQMMMGQFNPAMAMQQFMMGQMMCQMMTMMNGGCGMPEATPPQQMQQMQDTEETQRMLGQQVLANTRAALSRTDARRATQDDEEEDEDVRPGPSSNSAHPNYRPPEMKHVPGVTDSRFEGRLKLWFEDKGYGFIECEDLKKVYTDIDVFLHENQRRHFNRGDWLSFSVFLNYRGKPQGTELRKRRDPNPGDANIPGALGAS